MTVIWCLEMLIFCAHLFSTQNHAVQNVLLDNQLLSLKHEEQLLLHGQDLLQSITASSSAVQTYSVRTRLMVMRILTVWRTSSMPSNCKVEDAVVLLPSTLTAAHARRPTGRAHKC